MRLLLIFAVFFYIQFNVNSQTIHLDELSKNTDTIVEINYLEWVHFLKDGAEVYCGLPYNTINDTFKFYKTSEKNKLMCLHVNNVDSIFTWSYYNLKEMEENKFCWVIDGFLMSYNSRGFLMNMEFYDKGLIINPKPFFTKLTFEN